MPPAHYEEKKQLTPPHKKEKEKIRRSFGPNKEFFGPLKSKKLVYPPYLSCDPHREEEKKIIKMWNPPRKFPLLFQ